MRSKSKLPLILLLPVMTWSCSGAKQGNTAGIDTNTTMTQEIPAEFSDTATLGAGCFWCVEAIFQEIKGVQLVEAGYAGGHVKNPTYREVCDGGTGHIEVARIVYDTRAISYDQLLEVFWHTHNPTTMDRQGNDVGEQYRSVIFFHNATQEAAAKASLAKTDASGLWDDPIVTVIQPLNGNYYKAENYHQDYYNNNKTQGYCSAVIGPKIAKFRKQFPQLLKSVE